MKKPIFVRTMGAFVASLLLLGCTAEKMSGFMYSDDMPVVPESSIQVTSKASDYPKVKIEIDDLNEDVSQVYVYTRNDCHSSQLISSAAANSNSARIVVDLSNEVAGNLKLFTQVVNSKGVKSKCSKEIAEYETSGPINIGTGFDVAPTFMRVYGEYIYTMGAFTSFNGMPISKIARFHTKDFTLDTAFNIVGSRVTGGDVGDIIALTNGEYVIASGMGQTISYNGSAAKTAQKISATFDIVPTWNMTNPLPYSQNNHIQVGNYLAFMNFNWVKIYDLDGNLVEGVNGGVNYHGIATSPALGNKFVVTGRPTVGYTGAPAAKGIRLISLDGTVGDGSFNRIDSTFASNAGVGANASVHAPIVAPDGSYIITGTTTMWGGTNYSWNNGSPTANAQLYKVNIDGTQYAPWNVNITTVGNSGVSVCGIDSENRIYIIGNVATIDGVARVGQKVYRLKSDGTFDAIFSDFNNNVTGCMMISDEKIVFNGTFTTYKGVPAAGFTILNSDGESLVAD